MFSIEAPILSPDQTTALRSVHRTIYGGTHGRMTTIEPYGLACVSVIDGDYAGTAQVVDSLEPGRDVLALECRGYDPDHNDQQYIQRMQEIEGESALISIDPFDIATLAEQVRDGWVLSPHDYAYCLAIAKGVRVEPADASEEDRDTWLAWRRRHGFRNQPSLYEEAAFREVKMVERLGAIATTMDAGRWHDRAKLAMIVGDSHTRPIKAHLKNNWVYGTKVRQYSPNMGRRYAEDIGYIIRDEEFPHQERWIANARRILDEQ